jgi:hypothetical protein
MLFVRDVAKLRGMPLSTARKWLAELEREHGKSVVRRRGNRLWTTERALERIEPGSVAASEHATQARLRALERRAEKSRSLALAFEARHAALEARLEVLERHLRRALELGEEKPEARAIGSIQAD